MSIEQVSMSVEDFDHYTHLGIDSNISFSQVDSYISPETTPPIMWRSLIILSFNSLFGILGNSVVIMVYGGKTGSSSSDTFIFCLACLDFSVSFFYMPVSMYELITASTSTIICVVDKGASFGYVTTSFALFVCIALDRLVAVNRPYDYKQIMTVRRARFMGLICLVIGITSSIPFTKSCLTETTLDDHKHMQLLMKIYSVTVIALATFFTVSYINVFIIARRSARLRVDSEPSHSRIYSKHSNNIAVHMQARNNPSTFTRLSVAPQPNILNNAPRQQKSIHQAAFYAGKTGTQAIHLSVTINPAALNYDQAGPKSINEKSEDSQNEMSRYLFLRRRRSLRKQLQIALTLFFVTFTFIICYLPSALLDLSAWGFNIGSEFDDNHMEIILGLFWFSVPANPAIYAFTSPRFRKETRLMSERIRMCQIFSDDSI